MKNGIAELDAADAFLRGRDQLLSIENRGDEVLPDPAVARSRGLHGNGDVPHRRWGEAFVRRSAVLRHGGLVAGEREPLTLQYHLASLAGHFESVGSGCLTGGGHEDSGRAAVVFEVGGYFVLDLDVVKAPEPADPTNPRGQTEHPLPEVEVVRALVEQHAAALSSPRRPP